MPILTPDQLPIDAYHSAVPQYLSKTSIRDFIVHGPAYWKLAYLDRSIKRPTPDGALQGNMLDCMMTEGEESFEARFVVRTEGVDLRTKEGKAWAASVAGKEIVTHTDMDILGDAVAAVRALPCWSVLQHAWAQRTLRRDAPNLGFGLQSRPDWLVLDGRDVTTFDLKKTRSLAGFGKQAIDLGYALQASLAGWCLAGDGMNHASARLVAVEWERGARAREYIIPSEALADGFRQMDAAATEISRRLREGDWTDVQVEAEPLPIPEWMARRMEAA